MWGILRGYAFEEVRRAFETPREDDGGNSPERDTTNTSFLNPSPTIPPSGYIFAPSDPYTALSPLPPALLAAARNTVFRDVPRGPVHRERLRDTRDDFWEELRWPGLGRRLEPFPGVTVPQAGLSPRRGDKGKGIVPERGCVAGDNWPRASDKRPSTPPSEGLLPLTDWHRLVGRSVSEPSESQPQRPDHRSSDPRSASLPELPKPNTTSGGGRHVPSTIPKTTAIIAENEPPPRRPVTRPARPRYTQGLAMARAAGRPRSVRPRLALPPPRDPPRSDQRDALTDKWVEVPPWRQYHTGAQYVRGPWADDPREGRVCACPGLRAGLDNEHKLWFYEDIREGFYEPLAKQSQFAVCMAESLGEDGVDCMAADEGHFELLTPPRSGSFSRGWLFLRSYMWWD
ncbi:hypothetical protein CHU98_g4636 [Xylaria longipes]|nr:hypothetical protein CHU98_g4636 [Xylaria longipes]